MLNVVTLMGRLTADPELRVATSGKEICRFRMAVDRNGGDKVADFIPVICFGSSARFVEKHFGKGSMIAVQGRLQTSSYTDKNGNKRTAFEVVAFEVSFCGEKRGSAPADARVPDTSDEGGYYSTAMPGDFDEIGEEDYE